MKVRLPAAGFTLIELLIVMGILALVLAMGAPSILQTARKDGLRQAASDVVEGCSLARAQAILRGETAEFVIRGIDGRMSVRMRSTNLVSAVPGAASAEPTEGAEVAPGEVPGFSPLIPGDVAIRMIDVNLRDQMQADEVRVRFFPNGTSDEFTLVLENQDGIRKISLECVTGLASLEVLK